MSSHCYPRSYRCYVSRSPCQQSIHGPPPCRLQLSPSHGYNLLRAFHRRHPNVCFAPCLRHSCCGCDPVPLYRPVCRDDRLLNVIGCSLEANAKKSKGATASSQTVSLDPSHLAYPHLDDYWISSAWTNLCDRDEKTLMYQPYSPNLSNGSCSSALTV